MATITLTASAVSSEGSYASEASSYPLSNAVGYTASGGTKYAGVSLTTGSRATSYFSYDFDASAIPSDATINSVTANAKLYGSSTLANRTSSRTVQLYCGSTAKGSSTSWSASGSAVTVALTCGTWTREELDSLKLRVSATRNTSNTSNTASMYIMGMDVTIDYTPSTTYTLTMETNGHSVTPSESGTYSEGTQVQIIIDEDTLPTVTLDGTDITNDFGIQAAVTSYSGAPTASSYTGLSSGSSGVASAVGCTAESPYADSLNWYGSSGATVDSQYAEYTFDLSSIPSTATGISVACKVAGTAESTTYSHQSSGRYSVWALCCNGTEKSEQIYTTSGSVTVLEFSDTGSWTREELDGLQLRHYVGYYGGSTNGATLTITFSLPSTGNTYVYTLTMDGDHTVVVSSSSTGQTVLYVKRNGSWIAVSKVYAKILGSWTEVDVSSVFKNATNDTNSGFFVDT